MKPGIFRSLIGLVAYTWVAGFVWHLLPPMEGTWWAIPAICTTALIGMYVYWISYGDV
jgi:hypothetical protein